MVFDRFVVSNIMKSISSGVIAPSSVDIRDAYSKDVQCMKSLEGSNPKTVKIPKAAIFVQMPSRIEATLPGRQEDRRQLAVPAKPGTGIKSRKTCYS